MNRTRKYILSFFLCLAFYILPSQNIDSLESILKSTTTDTTKLRLFYELSNLCDEQDILKYTQPGIDLANNILKKSTNLSGNYKNVVLKYKALCIGNMGFVSQSQSDYSQAIKYYDESLKIQEEIGDKQEIAITCNNLAVSWQSKGDMATAYNYYERGIKIQDEIGDKAGKATSLGNLGVIYFEQGNTEKALECYFKALKIEEELGAKNGMPATLNCIGGSYNNLGDIQKAIFYFSEAAKVAKETDNKESLAQALGNMGAVYLKQEDIKKAMEFFNKSLKLNNEIGRKEGISTDLNNLGACYSKIGNSDKALEYYTKSLKIDEEIGNKIDTYQSLNNIANLYEKQQKFIEALNMYHKNLAFTKKLGYTKGMAQSYCNLSSLYFKISILPEYESIKPAGKKNKCNLAYAFADSALRVSKKLGFPYNISQAEALLTKLDSVKGNFAGAFEHYKQYIIYRDSINNETTKKASIKSQLKYEFDKKEAVIKEQQEKERAVSKEKSRFQQIVILTVIFGLLLVIIFAAFVFRSLKITRHQKIIIEEKQKEMLDSIYYAKRIQTSLLPTEKYIGKILKQP